MKKHKRQQLFMLNILLGYLSTNQLKTNMVLAFKNGATSLTNIVNQVLALIGPQNQSVIGSGSQKQLMRDRLNLITFTIINAARGYALSVQNLDLAGKLSESLSQISKIKDANISGRATNWMNMISPYMADLGTWGISDSSKEIWQTAINNFNAQFIVPKSQIQARKSITDQVNLLIAQGMSVCYNTLDTAINSYIELGEDQFIAGYKIARKQSTIPSRHTTLEAMVTNELGQPCINCTVTVNAFTKNGKTYKAVSVQTGINGNCSIKEFEPGIRTVTISGDTIVSKTFPAMDFKNGKIVQHLFICTPAFQNLPAAKQQKETVSN